MPVKKQASVKSIKRKARKSQKVVLGRAKEFTYRGGYTLEQLQKMDLQEVMKLLTARARRSLTREMNYEQKVLFEKLNSDEQNIKTHVRDMIILPRFVGKIVEVYNATHS